MANSTTNFSQETDIEEAALVLASFKHTNFDYKTLSTLKKLKKKFMRIQKRKNQSRKNHLQPIQDQALPGSSQIEDSKEIMKLIDEYIPPIIPPVESLFGVIGECSKPFEKQLTESDVNDGLIRLGTNKSNLKRFLSPLLNTNEDLKSGIPVNVYDSNGKKHKMVFKEWCSKLCVLTKGWTAFSHEHGLVSIQDFVTLWMFRHRKSGKLCFVVFSRRSPIYALLKRKKIIEA